jgi:hypothetical protein
MWKKALLFIICSVMTIGIGTRNVAYAQTTTPTPDPNDPTTICSIITDANQKTQCMNCAKVPGVWTAIGCIQTDPSMFFSKLLTFGIGIAGGIAFLLILLGGFQILVSAGNPEQMSAGRELVSSAVAGLLLIVFSVFLLRLIGYDILRIPGFLNK